VTSLPVAFSRRGPKRLACRLPGQQLYQGRKGADWRFVESIGLPCASCRRMRRPILRAVMLCPGIHRHG
jgi:hypothetical protein